MRYLGDVYGDILSAARTVEEVAQTVQRVGEQVAQVGRGQKKVVLVEPGTATVSVPLPGRPFGVAIPLWAVGLGLAVLFLALPRRR